MPFGRILRRDLWFRFNPKHGQLESSGDRDVGRRGDWFDDLVLNAHLFTLIYYFYYLH